MKKWLIPVLFVLAAGALAFAATRRLAPCSCRQDQEPFARLRNDAFLVRELGLTDTQRQQLEALHAEFASKLVSCCANHCETRAKLAAVQVQDAFDEAKAAAILTQMCDAYAAGERAAMEHVRRVRQVLEPEQKHRFDQMLHAAACDKCPTCGSGTAAAAKP